MEQDQLTRIKRMEAIFDEVSEAVEALHAAYAAYAALHEKYSELKDYYESPVWMADFDDDREGKLPSDLKRGILSEDGIYDLILREKEILDQIREETCAERVSANEDMEALDETAAEMSESPGR